MTKNLLIWTVAIALAVVSGTTAMGAITKYKANELALSLLPLNGFAAAAAASGSTKALIAKNLGKFPERVDSPWNALALQAFKAEPVATDAVAVVALSQHGQVRSDLMLKAFDLSRRQQLVTGWLIGNSANQDNISATLKYHDTSLRTSATTRGVIIPVLANALADRSFIKPFQVVLNENPPWANFFWKQVITTPNALENAADLRLVMHNSNVRNDQFEDAELINALVKAGMFGKAEQLFAKLSLSEKGTGIVKNSSFQLEAKFPPFDWQLFSKGDYGTFLEKGGLNLSAVQNSGGLFAQQLVKLPNDELILEAITSKEPPKSANLYLQLSCAEDIVNSPKAIKIRMNAKKTTRRISNRLSACEYYWLAIVGRSSDDELGFDVIIDSIVMDLAKVRS